MIKPECFSGNLVTVRHLVTVRLYSEQNNTITTTIMTGKNNWITQVKAVNKNNVMENAET